MKKRTMALLLAMVMLLSTSVFAAGLGDHTGEVTATYVEGNDESPIVYSVDITWDELDFTYYEASAPVWDPVNHQYVSSGQAEGWAENDVAEIELINHSNTDILATYSYAANAGYESAEMTFASTQTYIGSAENGYQKTATNTVSPSGTLPEGTDNAVIGYITIQIAACPDVDPQMANDWVNAQQTSLHDFEYYNENYDVLLVESADEVPSGKRYVLEDELYELSGEFTAFNTYTAVILSGMDDGAELNYNYYRTLTAAESFKNNNIYTKP